MRICIASPDVVGPIRNGGVGTAFAGLAEILVDAGHDVTMFYTSDYYELGTEADWYSYYADLGIEFVALKRMSTPPVRFQGTAEDSADVLRSYYVYEYLREQEFDVVHFPDYLGVGFYSCMAKRTGSAFANTLLCVTTHGPTLWSRPTNVGAIDQVSYLLRDALERGCVAHADHVVTPNRYMGEWLVQNQWAMAQKHSVIPGVLPRRSIGKPAAVDSSGRGEVDELVFFGRLEPRKGIFVFLDALDRLNPHAGRVTFLGKSPESPNFSKRVLGLRAQHWDFEWQVLDDLDTFEALDYLSSGKRVAVMPSVCDNSPYALLECMSRNIPVIVSNVGGIPELVAEEDHAGCLVAPKSADLAAAMERALKGGAYAPRPATSIEAHAETWLHLHDAFATTLKGAGAPGNGADIGRPALASSAPHFSVCILHRNRPLYLSQALGGLRRQTMSDFEIVIADNGSDTDAANAYLDELETGSNKQPIRVLRLGENRFPAGGRNAAAAEARGRYIKFLDDDNVPKRREMAAFATALETDCFDVVSCALDFFDSDVPPGLDNQADARFLWLGDGASTNYLFNVMGDANFAIRRDKFEELGGFDDDGFLYHAEDWRFLCKAKAWGLRIGTIPDGLVWYRRDAYRGRSNWRKGDTSGARYRAMFELSGDIPIEARNLMLLAQGALFRHKTD